MKNMNKVISFILCLLLTCSFMFGCGNTTTEKTITLAWGFGVKEPVWEKVVSEYKKLNPDVTIKMDGKDGQTYNSWLANQLISKTDADIVINNGVSQFYAQNKFVDFSQYINKGNPYADDEVWSEVLESSAYQPYSGSSEIVYLNNSSVVTAWFYNKDTFDDLGVIEHMGGKQPQNWNWDDLVTACQYIKGKGKIPLGLAGDYSSFWAWQGGWLYRVYLDQYFRDMENLTVAQPGDYCYDLELQSTWTFNKNDKDNDNNTNFIPNFLRVVNSIKDKTYGPTHPKYKDMIKNFSRIIPEYVPDGFTAMSNEEAARKFILGDVAIYIDLLSFYAGIERTFSDNDAEPFEVGVFQYPPMTSQAQGVEVGVDYTRDPGGSGGYYGIIYKNKEQAQLAVDFLMYFFSPQGQNVYLNALAEENIAPEGVSLIKGVTIPEKWKGKYDLQFPGKSDSNPISGSMATGFMGIQESIREFVEQSQSYYKGEINLDTYCNNLYQKMCMDNVNAWLKNSGYRKDALDNPAVNPKSK